MDKTINHPYIAELLRNIRVDIGWFLGIKWDRL